MAGVIRRFDNGLIPGQVPQGFLSIDWTHPLANGLMFYYLPGVTTFDVALKDPQPVGQFGGSFLFGSSPEGPAGDCTINNAGNGFATASSSIPGASSVTAMSIYARGYKAGVPPTNTAVIGGLTFANPNVSPFVMLWLQYGVSTTIPRLAWNHAGSLTPLPFITSFGTSQPFSLGGSIVSGGNAKVYYNGVLDNSTAGVTLTASNGAVLIGGNGNMQHTILCGWNRELTADEMMRIHLDPYGMLIPAEFDLPAVALATTTKFRRTLSQIGTRTGSRQIQGWAA